MKIPTLDTTKNQYKILEYLVLNLPFMKCLNLDREVKEIYEQTGFFYVINNRWDKINNCYYLPNVKSKKDLYKSKDYMALNYIYKMLFQNNFITIEDENNDLLIKTGVLQMLFNHWTVIEKHTHLIVLPKI